MISHMHIQLHKLNTCATRNPIWEDYYQPPEPHLIRAAVWDFERDRLVLPLFVPE